MRSTLSYFVIASVAALMHVSSVAAASGGFASTCSDSGVSATILHANCKRDDKSKEATQIDLSNCLSNNNGQIGCGFVFRPNFLVIGLTVYFSELGTKAPALAALTRERR